MDKGVFLFYASKNSQIFLFFYLRLCYTVICMIAYFKQKKTDKFWKRMKYTWELDQNYLAAEVTGK